MPIFSSFKSFTKFIAFGTIVACFPSFADTQSDNLQLAPIFTIKKESQEDKEKTPPAPGLSFGVPSAYGSSDNTFFVGVSYGASVEEGLNYGY